MPELDESKTDSSKETDLTDLDTTKIEQDVDKSNLTELDPDTTNKKDEIVDKDTETSSTETIVEPTKPQDNTEHETKVDDSKEETQIRAGSDDGTKQAEDLNSEATDDNQTKG